MKKWMEIRWKRFLAICLASALFTVSVCGFLGIILAESMGAYDTKQSVLYSRGERNLQSIYSKKIYENMNTDPGCMEGSRMEYAIIRAFDLTDSVIADQSRCLYHTENFYKDGLEGKKLTAENFYPDVKLSYIAANVPSSIFSNGDSDSSWSYLDEVPVRKRQEAEKSRDGDLAGNLSILYDSYLDSYDGMEYGEDPAKVRIAVSVDEKARRMVYNADEGVFYYESDDWAYPVEEIEIRYSALLDSGNIKKIPSREFHADFVPFVLKEKDGRMRYLSDDEAQLVLDTEKYNLWGDINGEYTQITSADIKKISSAEMLPRILHTTGYIDWMKQPEKYEELNKKLPYFQYTGQDVKAVEQYWVVSYVEAQGSAGSTEVNDLFGEQRAFIAFLYHMRYLFIVLAAAPLLFGIIFTVMICLAQNARGRKYAAGQLPGNAARRRTTYVPLFVHLTWIVIAAGCLIGGTGVSLEELSAGEYSVNIGFLLIGIAVACTVVCAYFVIWFLAEAAFRKGAKTRKLFWEKLKEWRDDVRDHFSLLAKSIVILAVLTLLELWVIGVTDGCDVGVEIFFFLIYKAAEVFFVLTVVLQLRKLQKMAEQLAKGDLNSRMDTTGLLWEFKKHGDYLNQISDGMIKAVDERIKSEHFKTELITNVSHDIKTPLTSIINYVDLMKKETIAEERVLEYLEVLDRQSARMKKLVEDLIEASKVSTGNVAVNLETCDISILLTQMTGEYGERFEQAQLELLVSQPEQPLYILADNQHLWRIFDNLMNNIYKYAQPGSRVYIDVARQDRKVQIVFRNMSKYALNISSDELLERFVRGDSSRNAEGSGLGLSIAQSLSELMGGGLELYIDGDLFKVVVCFPENM